MRHEGIGPERPVASALGSPGRPRPLVPLNGSPERRLAPRKAAVSPEAGASALDSGETAAGKEPGGAQGIPERRLRRLAGGSQKSEGPADCVRGSTGCLSEETSVSESDPAGLKDRKRPVASRRRRSESFSERSPVQAQT